MKHSFVCLGFPKCATTTLDSILRQHPQIKLPCHKETLFFEREDLYRRGISWYESRYYGHSKSESFDKIYGEINPRNIGNGNCEKNVIKTFGEEVKLIYIIRNPVDALFSWFRNLTESATLYERCKDNVITENSFDDYVNSFLYSQKREDFRYRMGFAQYKYGCHLATALKYVPIENVYVVLFEDYINVCIPYTFWVECCNNSSIYIDKEVILKDKCTMLCFEKSDIQLGAGGHYGVGFSMSCRNNSQICVGKYLNWTMGGGIYCLNNSRIVIGDKFYVGKDSIITCRRQSSLIIGDDCSVQWFFICASEYEGTVVIKDRFMASYNVSIFNNDTHPIFDVEKAKQINRDRKIIISEHVWAGIKSTILSGAEIGQSCIIGANSVITKKFPNNCTLGGIPARILNKNMTWDVREEDISNVDQKYNCLTEEEEESVNV